MKLALITPTANLAMSALLPGRFCIASIAATQPKYADWFQEQQACGCDVMLDNGVFEGDQMTPEAYSQVVNRIRPKIIIAPDTINGDVTENYETAAKFITGFIDILAKSEDKALTEYKPEFMFVLQRNQNNNITEVNAVLKAVTENENFKWVGLCRDFAYQMFGNQTHTEDQELNRFVLGTWLQREGWIQQWREIGKKIHFLGIGDKVNMLQYAWYVDSADTASFMWQASMGNTIGGIGVLHTKYRRPYNYFDLDFGTSKEMWATVAQNCSEAQRYAQMAQDLRRTHHNIVSIDGRL